MKLDLTQQEQEYLLVQLRDQLGILREQLHHATITKFSDQLKEHVALVRGLIEKLEQDETSEP